MTTETKLTKKHSEIFFFYFDSLTLKALFLSLKTSICHSGGDALAFLAQV